MGKPRPNSVDNHFSGIFRTSIVFILLLAIPLASMAESIGCDDNFVQLNNNTQVINVAATGIDDTTNIQCALDAAAGNGYPTVKLGAGTYFISGLIVENFSGTLEGTTMASTIIEVPDRSVDCFQGMELVGLSSAVIKFIEGEPRIRFLTIRANRPCSSTGFIHSILHFTGESAFADNCDNDVIFAAADRIIIETTENPIGPNWVNTGVLVSAEGNQLGGCKNTLLGTFKLNRSTISNMTTGVRTSMKAGAQVDINFNEFSNNEVALFLFDTNQNTTVTTNKFIGESKPGDPHGTPYWAIYLQTFSVDAPASSRVVIHNNQFNLTAAPDVGAFAISLEQIGRIANISSAVTGNKFTLSGNAAYGILGRDVTNTQVSANHFSGTGSVAITVTGASLVTGWTITANTGLENFSSIYGVDINLTESTSECIVGPGQGADVNDLGTNNVVLVQ